MPDYVELILYGPNLSAQDRSARETQRLSRRLGKQLDRVVSAQSRAIERAHLDAQGVVQALRAEADATRELLALGFTALHQQLEATSAALADPGRVQASAKLRDGLYAFQQARATGDDRWIDDAIADLEAAIEADRYNFVPHLFLGRIHTEYRADPDRAMPAFDAAARYAWPAEPVVAALALLELARWNAALAKTADALTLVTEATAKAPELAIAHLERGRISAVEGDCASATDSVEIAIGLDPGLFDAAAVDLAFKTCPEVAASLTDLYEKGHEFVRAEVDAWSVIAARAQAIVEVRDLREVERPLADLSESVDRLATSSSSYVDLMGRPQSIRNMRLQLVQEVRRALERRVEELRNEAPARRWERGTEYRSLEQDLQAWAQGLDDPAILAGSRNGTEDASAERAPTNGFSSCWNCMKLVSACLDRCPRCGASSPGGSGRPSP